MGTTRGLRLDRFFVGEGEGGERVDRFLARKLGISRSLAHRLLRAGTVQVNGNTVEPSRRLNPGEEVQVHWAGPGLKPTPFPLPIIYEDEAIVVVNKPRGLPVHPVGPSEEATVVTALLARGPLAGGSPERPGVVHRLDAATTGVLVLSRTERAYRALVQQFKERKILKEYLAVVEGEVEVDEGVIKGRIGRDPHAPWRMDVQDSGKEAQTEFTVLSRKGGRSLLLVRPVTGRTHQIRLHLKAIGHPIVGDELYGKGSGPLLLHALRLGLFHPIGGDWREFQAPPPPEFHAWFAEEGNKFLRQTERQSPPSTPKRLGG
ncbi:MAG: RluA family pseudouridine synthase [Candidatus Bipolaricaulota bacterium]|nr:RluA family pseudouridine synthase [Candidatus Bipolaricaulota bacterium]MDW8126528.1 RluA family pseudouridine synthase [Candidatus Bipolaricaulota bacterium]